MNSSDKQRQLELVNRVWALVASRLLLGFDKDDSKRPQDAYLIYAEEIEGHAGRFPKALRLLEAGGYVTPFGKMVVEYKGNVPAYRVLRFEESKANGQKPDMVPSRGTLNNELSCKESPEMIARAGYKAHKELSDEEKIYVWWHKDEYEQDPARPRYLSEIATLETTYRRTMFVLIERRLKEDFPGYIQMIAPEVTAVSFETTEITVPNPITFQDFNPDGIKRSLDKYMIELERMTRYKADHDAIRQRVAALGGFKATIKHIRQVIMADFLNGYERFPQGFLKVKRAPLAPEVKDEGEPGRSDGIFRFFDRFRDLCSYESIYLDTNIGTEEVSNYDVRGNSWTYDEVGSLTYKTLAEEFGFEEGNTGVTEDSEAA